MAMSFAVSSKLSLRGSVTCSRRPLVATKAVVNQYAKSLPGITDPFPEGFDPLEISKTASVKDMKRWRESELHHGRIAMLAALGFIVQEQVQNNPSFDWLGGRITGPAIYHWQQTSGGWQQALLLAIGALEVWRITVGWKTPTDSASFQALREDYPAGDLGFDPLNLAPKDPAEFKDMQSKELNNGRLAMIAVLAFTVQELIYQKDLLTVPGFKSAWDAAPLDLRDIKRPPLPVEYPGKGTGMPSLVKPPTMGSGLPNIGDIKPPQLQDFTKR